MTELILTRGISASGKTTEAKRWVAENPVRRARVNRDDIRESLWPGYSVPDRAREEMVTEFQRSKVIRLLTEGYDVMVDDCHLAARWVKPWYELAASVGATVRFLDFPVDLDEAIARDLARGRTVGEEVIRHQARFLKKGKLPPIPAVPEKTVQKFTPYVGDPELPDAYIFDIDGTLAKMNGRSPYDPSLYHTDTVHEPVRRILRALSREHDTLIVTGRDGKGRDATVDWLADSDIQYDALFTRAADDDRDDGVVKAEILHRDIAPRWNVLGAFDDRDRVVDAWRAMGVKCFQVERGNF